MLSLARHDESGFSRANGRDPQGIARRKTAARSPRFRLEELETRVLLSGDQGFAPIHLIALNFPPRTADVTPISPPALSHFSELQSPQRPVPALPESTSSGVVFLQLNMSSPGGPQMLAIIGPPVSAEQASANAAFESDPTTEYRADQAQAAGVSPDLATSVGTGESSPLTSIALDGTEAGTQANSAPGWGGLRAAVAAAGAAPYATVQGGSSWQTLPMARHLDVSGTLDADQPTMSFQIPLDTMTQSLTLSVRPTGENGELPFFDQIEVVGPTGVQLAQVAPPNGPGSAPARVDGGRREKRFAGSSSRSSDHGSHRGGRARFLDATRRRRDHHCRRRDDQCHGRDD